MADTLHISRLGKICLRVRDRQRTRDFYCKLLGFEELPNRNGGETLNCVLHGTDGCPSVEIVLTEGLPPGHYLVGLDHFSFEAPTAEAVNRVFEMARERAFQATNPRTYNGRWQTFVFDPDGYKIEVFCSQAPCNSAHARQTDETRSR